MPASTIASESAFTTGGHVLDSSRASLSPRMVEPLICAQEWLRKSYGPLILEGNFLELEDLENSKLSYSYCTCIYVFIHINY